MDLKLCPGLLLPALMKDEECEGTSDIFLQKSVQKKAKNFNLLIPTASIFCQGKCCELLFTLTL